MSLVAPLLGPVLSNSFISTTLRQIPDRLVACPIHRSFVRVRTNNGPLRDGHSIVRSSGQRQEPLRPSQLGWRLLLDALVIYCYLTVLFGNSEVVEAKQRTIYGRQVPEQNWNLLR